MRSIHLKSDEDIMYTIDPVEETAKREVVEGKANWSVKYELKDHNNHVIGDGVLSTLCPDGHEHLADKDIFAALVRTGAMKIKKDLEDDRMLTNRKYEIKVKTCSHLA